MKYLKGVYFEIGELKKAFRDLLMVLHPDKNPSPDANEECAILISEYESLIKKILKKSAVEREQHKPESERVYRPSDFYSMDQSFVDAMMKTISLHMENVSIEVCGWFLYVSGNTKPYKDSLKEIGYKWQSVKSMWALAPSWWSAGKNHKPWSMDQIRGAYGSRKVEEEKGLVVV